MPVTREYIIERQDILPLGTRVGFERDGIALEGSVVRFSRDASGDQYGVCVRDASVTVAPQIDTVDQYFDLSPDEIEVISRPMVRQTMVLETPKTE